MSTNPNMNQAPIPQGFSPEELAQFGIQAIPPETEKPKDDGPSAEERMLLAAQAITEQQRQNNMLQQQLMRERELQQTQTSKPTNEITIPEKIPVEFDAEGNAFVKPTEFVNLSKSIVDQYHNQVIAPEAEALETVKRQARLEGVTKWLNSVDPSLLEGQDTANIAGLAVGLYHSELNPGRTDQEKSDYVAQQLRSMKQAPGNPLVRDVIPHSQVGRTEMGAQSNLPARGSTIKILRTTAQEMGLDAFQQSIAMENYYRDLDAQHKLGLKFDIQRPD